MQYAAMALPDSGTVEIDRTNPDVLVASLLGEHDVATSDSLRSTLDALVDERTRTIIDLDRVEFVDSATLHVLVSVDERARHAGARPEIRLAPGSFTDKVFRITGLHEQLRCEPG